MTINSHRLILVPALNLQILHLQRAEGLNKRLRQPRIRQQGHTKIHGRAADFVVVIQLAFRQVFGDINDQVNFLLLQIRQHVGLLQIIGPEEQAAGDAVFGEEMVRALRGIHGVALFYE